MIVLDKEERAGPASYTHITKCKPFVINSRAKLAHRPRHAVIIKLGDFEPHTAVTYWCGNHVTGKKNIDFQNDTDGRFMCLQCEKNAVEAGKPTSSQLAGIHVCTGKVVAIKECHCDCDN